MPMTQRTKKAGKVIGAGTVGGLVVAAAVKMAFAWAVNVDDTVNRHEVEITKVQTVQEAIVGDMKDAKEERKEQRIEQKAMRADMNENFDELKDLIRGDR